MDRFLLISNFFACRCYGTGFAVVHHREEAGKANMRHVGHHHHLTIVVLCLVFLSQVVLADDPVTANREAVMTCVRNIAARAQRYYHTPISEGGGSGSFATTTLSALISRPLNEYGSFVLSSPSATSVTLTGVGIETGYDGATPLAVYAIVYSDSVTIIVTN